MGVRQDHANVLRMFQPDKKSYRYNKLLDTAMEFAIQDMEAADGFANQLKDLKNGNTEHDAAIDEALEVFRKRFKHK